MSDRDLLRQALEAGFDLDGMPNMLYTVRGNYAQLERLVELARADERKRLHDKFMEIHKSQQHSNNYWHFAARKIMEES